MRFSRIRWEQTLPMSCNFRSLTSAVVNFPLLLAVPHLRRVLACIVGLKSRTSLIYSFWFQSQILSCGGISTDQGQPTSCSIKK